MATSGKSYDFLDPPSRSGDLGMLGHYCVQSELGRGGMGYVFRAEDTKLKRTVALKVMNQKIAATPHSRRRFIHEARAMAAVHHDNVVMIFEVGESKGTPFMAMEMLKGGTIESFNDTKAQLTYEQIIEYAKQIARGLAVAHSNGIVHRDIKPANIWIEEGTNRVKILDFGLALASTPVDHLAGRGAVIGTPGYLSPEQARSDSLDDRSDLYSLGVVLYELCTSQLPIQSKSVSGQLISILAHRPKPINEINPEIPQPLCDIVHRLLRKEPRKRPSSAAKLAEDLDRVEVECHAKSDVAQAINKLQMGLSEVVSKKESETFFEEIHETIPNPLAMIPDPLAAMPAAVTMVPPARPVARNVAAAKSSSAWQAYWPFAAIGAAVLIVLSVLAYALSGKGSGTDSVAVANASSSPRNDSASTTQSSSSAASQSPAPEVPDQSANRDQAGNSKGQGNGDQVRRKGNQKNRNAGRQINPGQPAAGDNTQPTVETSSVAGSTDVVPVSTSPNVSMQETEPRLAPQPPASEPDQAPTLAEMTWTTITTGEGRGADVMVQNGMSHKQGLKTSIGVAMRKKLETHHSYLRFDLARIENVKSHVKTAGIILTPVGREPVVGAVVRVYGIADVPLWPEEGLDWKHSFSEKGLNSLPLLGQTTVTADDAAPVNGRHVIRVTGPEFAKFIAAAGDTVTLAIAGSGSGAEPLRFVSRESSINTPPALLVHVPKNPPPDEKKNRRR